MYLMPHLSLKLLYILFIVLVSIIPNFSSSGALNCSATGMDSQQVQNQLASMREALLREGFVDEMFSELEELQDNDNPNLAEEIVNLFFKDSFPLINNIEQSLDKRPLDFIEVDKYMHKFKGGSSIIGAAKLMKEVKQFREYCKQENPEGCISCFEQVKKEHAELKKKLETYFELAREVGPSETASCPQ